MAISRVLASILCVASRHHGTHTSFFLLFCSSQSSLVEERSSVEPMRPSPPYDGLPARDRRISTAPLARSRATVRD